MESIEYVGYLLPDGHLRVPDYVIQKLKLSRNDGVKVTLIVKGNDDEGQLGEELKADYQAVGDQENAGEVKKHQSLFELEEELNFRAYERLKEELLTKYKGQYVAIAKGQLLVVANDFDQAMAELKAMVTEANHFLVFQAGEEPEREVVLG